MYKKVAIIVAHPDDETLWAGGTILSHPEWDCFIVSICRGKDPDRAPKFFKVLKVLNSKGIMDDLDDGPEQNKLNEFDIDQTILNLLPQNHYDLIITHNPNGEYTRHLRHEEVSRSVIHLWSNRQITTTELWTFAYEDGNREYFPRPIKNAPVFFTLTNQIWGKKYQILNEIYGFGKNSWELLTTPREEAFWKFTNSLNAKNWLNNGGVYK